MRRILAAMTGIAMFGAWMSWASAQGGAPTTGTSLMAPPGDRIAELAGANLRPSDLQTMSMEELVRKGDRLVEEMDRAVKDVLGRLTQAVQENDFARINCVNQTLTLMKGLLRLSGQNAIALREAVASRDRAAAEHEYVKLHIAGNRILLLRDQARACGVSGGETLFLGRQIVERHFDEDIPRADVSEGLQEAEIGLQVPPSASPYY